jgi:hypothetical protein
MERRANFWRGLAGALVISSVFLAAVVLRG